MKTLTQRQKYYLLLLLISGLAFLPQLAKNTPPTIMEARNFISAREMVETGDLLIPTLNGNIRIKKPPLPVWLTAGSIAVTGELNDLFMLRLPAVLAGILMVFFAYKLAEELLEDREASFYSAAILATSYLIIEQSRAGTWDIFCHAFMVGAIYKLVQAAKNSKMKYWLWAGILMGASFLSKAPVAFYAMLLPFLIAFFYSKHSFKPINKAGLSMCCLIVLLLSISWPLYLYFNIPNLATQVMHEETSAWINRHNRPVWFYLHFPLFMGIWSVVALYGLFSFKKLKFTFSDRKARLMLIWFLATFVLLSVVPEKKERYFLPALLPLAIITGMLIKHHLYNPLLKKDKIILWIQKGILFIATVAVFLFTWYYGFRENEIGWIYIIIAGIGALSLLIWWGKTFQSAHYAKHVYLHSLFVMLLFCICSWGLLDNFTRTNEDYEDLRQVRNVSDIMDKKLYAYKELDPVQIWEIGKKVIYVDSTRASFYNEILISEKPINDTIKAIEFSYHPKNTKMLYFNIY